VNTTAATVGGILGAFLIGLMFLLGYCYYKLRKAEKGNERLRNEISELNTQLKKVAPEVAEVSAPLIDLEAGDGDLYAVD